MWRGRRTGRSHQGSGTGGGRSTPASRHANGVGTPIRAAKAGTVILAGWNGGYGNCIVIDHGGGFSTLYGHMSRLRASEGQRVSQGDLIGDMGSTGNSTGPHLHFETRVNGNPQDPTRYLPEGRRP